MVRSDTALLKYVMRHDNKSDMLHSSGYAKAQSGESFGAAGGSTFSERQNIEEKRRYIQGYRNSKIMNEYYGVERARATVPRAGGAGRSSNAGGSDNPMDVAMSRAKFSASGGRGMPATAGMGGQAPNRGPVLNNARAPQIPTRRAGI
ncbi:hypothetical protein IK112_03245 [Candidatus Saccharibacteria bacterium]|nr:hypothetical protein [Candidatus Saccharibacteria bacterium]